MLNSLPLSFFSNYFCPSFGGWEGFFPIYQNDLVLNLVDQPLFLSQESKASILPSIQTPGITVIQSRLAHINSRIQNSPQIPPNGQPLKSSIAVPEETVIIHFSNLQHFYI